MPITKNQTRQLIKSANLARKPEVAVQITRGNTILALQMCRVVTSLKRTQSIQSQSVFGTTSMSVLFAAIDMDIQSEDRFVYNAQRYRVIAVAPDKTIQTVAEVECLQ